MQPGFPAADIDIVQRRERNPRLEPGVSFAALHAHLRGQGARWYMPAIGGPPAASVLANILQRGDGTGPGGEAAGRLLAADIVLPGGESLVLSRGLAGPDLMGLFTQSCLGAVTGARIGLQRLPEHMTLFGLRVARAGLARTVDALAGCLRDGILAAGACALWNEAKLRARGSVPRGLAVDDWVISGAQHAASTARAAADWADLVARLGIGTDRVTLLAREEQSPTGRGLFQGEPTSENLASVRAGLGDGAVSPEPGQPGFAWLCPLVPFEGGALLAFEGLARAVLEPAGIAASLAVACTDFRTLRGFVAIAWDRADAAMERRALAAHDTLFAGFTDAGMPPFRIGHLNAGWVPPGAALIAALEARDPRAQRGQESAAGEGWSGAS